MDKLMVELMEAVDKNLPVMVGDQLKARLVQADKDKETAAKVPALESMVAECKKKLEMIQTREGRVTARESEATNRETKVAMREGLVELREKHAQERVQELRGVVSDVFANSRFKYEETFNAYGNNGSSGGSRQIESSEVPGKR